MAVYSFDVAVSAAALSPDGTRDTSSRWVRVVVAADRLVEAHLTAAQMAARRGVVVDVLLRE